MSAPERRWLVVVLVFAVLLRLGAVLHFAGQPLAGDERSYDSIALNLAEGHGYQLGYEDQGRTPTAQRGPVYVLYLAAFYRTFGHHVLPPLVAQALLDVVSGWLVFRLASRWFRRDGPALAAAAMYAAYPPIVLQSAQLLTETSSAFLLLVTVSAYFAYLDGRRAGPLLLAGAALGLCVLDKIQFAPVGAVLALAALPALGWRTALRTAVVVSLVAAALLVPWTVRNAQVFHGFVPGVTGGGISFWGGTAPARNRTVGSLTDPWVPDSLRRALSDLDELQASRWLMRDAVRVIGEDPARYAVLTARRFVRLWFNLLYDDPPSRASLVLALAQAAALALAWVGMRRARPDPVAARTLWMLALFWTLVYLPFNTVVRYTMPFFAILLAFTAAGTLEVLRRAWPRSAAAAALLALLVAAPAAAAEAPDAAKLTAMLGEFLAGAGVNDPAAHEKFWAEDLVYTGSGGRRVGKADILKDVRSAPPPQPGDPKVTYGAEDLRIRQYGSTAVVAFRLVATTVRGDTTEVANFLNSGTFVRRGGRWQVVCWQATRMPAPEAKP